MKPTTKCLIAFIAFIMIAISCNKDDDGGLTSGNNDPKRLQVSFLQPQRTKL